MLFVFHSRLSGYSGSTVQMMGLSVPTRQSSLPTRGSLHQRAQSSYAVRPPPRAQCSLCVRTMQVQAGSVIPDTKT